MDEVLKRMSALFLLTDEPDDSVDTRKYRRLFVAHGLSSAYRRVTVREVVTPLALLRQLRLENIAPAT